MTLFSGKTCIQLKKAQEILGRGTKSWVGRLTVRQNIFVGLGMIHQGKQYRPRYQTAPADQGLHSLQFF